jgi:hypothetical protein
MEALIEALWTSIKRPYGPLDRGLMDLLIDFNSYLLVLVGVLKGVCQHVDFRNDDILVSTIKIVEFSMLKYLASLHVEDSRLATTITG